MKYDVTIRPVLAEHTFVVDAASPSLAAQYADKRFGLTHDVIAVGGKDVVGVCLSCKRFIFNSASLKVDPEGEQFCKRCWRNQE